MLSHGTVVTQVLVTTPFTPPKQQLKTNAKLQNNVHVKYAQSWNGGDASVGNDSLHAPKATTESKWETLE